MFKTNQNTNIMVVDLATGVKVQTAIVANNQAALRSGFAGYPVNPRWGAVKYRAWKTGRELKESLQEGKLVVRASDSMLVVANSSQNIKQPYGNEPKSKLNSY
jgi:hypothetical protein